MIVEPVVNTIGPAMFNIELLPPKMMEEAYKTLVLTIWLTTTAADKELKYPASELKL